MQPIWPAVFSAVLLFVGGPLVALLTYQLTRHKEREADWRRLKLDQYREFILALSGIVEGRATAESHLRYTDAVNAMMLVAPASVYRALQAFLRHNSSGNRTSWTSAEHDRLLNILVRAMRTDTNPERDRADDDLAFGLIAPPRVQVIDDGASQHEEGDLLPDANGSLSAPAPTER
jgi:hypothetical protein